MRIFVVLAVLSTVLGALLPSACRAQETATQWTEVSSDVPRDAVSVLKDEEARAGMSGIIWTVSFSILTTYAVWEFVSDESGSGDMKYFAAAGAVGALLSVLRSLDRGRQLSVLRISLETEMAPGEPPTQRLSANTVRAVGKELGSIHATLKEAASGSLRASCILPVLLSGIGVFGLGMGGPMGQDLAGISLAGALGIGGPSMLYYFGVQDDIERMDSLMNRWNGSFR